MNDEKILTSVKKVLGIEPDVDVFDEALTLNVNTALSILNQLGVGPKEGLYISENDMTWLDLIGHDRLLSMVKTYVCQKVRLLFDPPSSSALLDAMERSLKELEWRILAVTDTQPEDEPEEFVDKIARAAIEAHSANKNVHKTEDDVDKIIHNIAVIHGTL